MMKRILLSVPLLLLLGCTDAKVKDYVDKGDAETVGKADYFAMVDAPEDCGQYWSIEPRAVPKEYYVCPMGGNITQDAEHADLKKGRYYTNMCESLAGLAARAVEAGESDCAIWLEDPNNRYSYTLCKQELQRQGAKELAATDGVELLRSRRFSGLVKGFVLTDIDNNPESEVVATVAAHVHSAIVVDVRVREAYEEMGLEMVYDASRKTTRDAWKEFRDKCNNRALVISSSTAHELRDFVVANNLFLLNLKNDDGNNWDVMEEVLGWLSPCSPVYGWESFDEHSFVQRVTEHGHLMVPSNYYMNMPLTSINYSQKQKSLLANVLNPANRIYQENDTSKYVSYYLSDGDNVQWVFFTWYDEWFKHKHATDVKMAFGIPSTNLSMIAPPAYKHIVDHQGVENTLVENCGGGYIYIDDFAKKANGQDGLEALAKKVGAHMRQHRIKVLGLFANDVTSEAAQNAYRTFIKANNWLEGVIAVQYHPYNGGHGHTYWFPNSDGIDIPVISVRYTLWDFGENNSGGQGTPAYVARLLQEEQPDFSLIDVHAWSNFADIGNSTDEVGETKGTKNVKGAGAAYLCQRRLPKQFKCVSLQEFIWRMRMKHNREQTLRVLETYR